MKVAVASTVFPDVKNVVTKTYNRFFLSLRNRLDHEEVWIIIQPDRFETRTGHGRTVISIRGFGDAVSLLREIRPDCLFVSGLDFMYISLNIAARHLGIPVFTINVGGAFNKKGIESLPAGFRLRWLVRSFTMDRVSTDATGDMGRMRKGRFIAAKSAFLYRTLRKAGSGPVSAAASPCREIILIMRGRISHYAYLPDYYFLRHESPAPDLIRNGISEGAIFVVGNAMWEDFSIGPDRESRKIGPEDPVNVLILTSPLYEHAHWSYRHRNDFVTSLVSGLRKDPGISISFKLHPSSENGQDYVDMFRDSAGEIRFFQKENISDIIGDFDVVVSYGPTTAQTEVVASGVRLVLVRSEPALSPAELTEEGAESGLVTRCEHPSQVAGAVRDSLKGEIALSDAFVARRGELFPRENPSDRMAGIVAGILSGQ